jgi:hypothetical protein
LAQLQACVKRARRVLAWLNLEHDSPMGGLHAPENCTKIKI